MASLDGRPCTTGLITKRGSEFFVVTAGHCLQNAHYLWWGPDGGMIGPMRSTSFPGDDFGLIRDIRVGKPCQTGQKGNKIHGYQEASGLVFRQGREADILRGFDKKLMSKGFVDKNWIG
jgi:hypothetical protein